MSIEEYLTRSAEAQERTATALEAIFASLTGLATPAADKPADKPASTGSRRQAKNVEREDKPAEPPADEGTIEQDLPQADEGGDALDETPAEEATFTEEEVRKALKTYRDIEGSAATMAILKEAGADGMGTLKKEKYAFVMSKVR